MKKPLKFIIELTRFTLIALMVWAGYTGKFIIIIPAIIFVVLILWLSIEVEEKYIN